MKRIAAFLFSICFIFTLAEHAFAQPSGFGDRSLLYGKPMRIYSGGTTTVFTDGNINNDRVVGAENSYRYYYEFSPAEKVSRVYIRNRFGQITVRLTFTDGTTQNFSITGGGSLSNKYRNNPQYEKDVRRVDLWGTLSGSLVYEFDLERYVELGIPQDLRAEARNGEVTLSWSAAPAATGYYVYKNGVKLNEEPISGTTATMPAENNVIIMWQVSATNGLEESPLSDPVNTYFDSIPPSPPTNLTGTTGNGWARLTWKKNTENDIDGYIIYRDGQAVSGILKENTFIDTGLTNGVQYVYQVTALDVNENESSPSNPVLFVPVPTPPITPTGVKTNPGNEYVQIVWNPNPEPDIQGYHLYRDGVRITDQPVSETSFIDTGLTNFVEYQYQVSAVNTDGMESPLSAVVIGIPENPDVTPPDPPSGVQVTPGEYQELIITWEPNTEDDLKGYYVYRDGKLLNSEPITETTYTDTGLKNGKTYTYTLRAVDISGNISSPSVPVAGIPEPPASAPPENVRARAGNGVVTITWNQKYKATVYVIYRDGEMIGTATGTEYIDTSVTNGTTYAYQVSAFVGGVESELSFPVTATPRDFLEFSFIDQISVTLTDVMRTAWNFLSRWNPYLILILALVLVPSLINFIVWLKNKVWTPKDRGAGRPDNETEQERTARERDEREREREKIRELIRDQERERDEKPIRERLERAERPERPILAVTSRDQYRPARGPKMKQYAGREVREPREMRPGRRRRDERY